MNERSSLSVRIGYLMALLSALGPGATEARALDPELTLRVSTPMIFSAAAGLKFGEGEDYDPVIEGEAGVGGGRIAVGIDSIGDGIGLGLNAVFLRTWGKPANVDEDQSFLGLEGELGIQRLVLSIGGYRRVSAGEDDWIGSAGIGFRF